MCRFRRLCAAVVFGALLVSCGSSAESGTTAISTTGPAGDSGAATGTVVPVGRGHVAADMRALVSTLDRFNALARERGVVTMCAEASEPQPWHVCAVADEGLVAVVWFGESQEFVVEFTSPDHRGVIVPLDPNQMYGVVHSGGLVRLDVMFAGEVIGSIEGQP